MPKPVPVNVTLSPAHAVVGLYVAQIFLVLYFNVFPVAQRYLEHGIVVEVKRGSGLVDCIPVIGVIGMSGCSHTVTIRYNEQMERFGIDLVEDLDIENLHIVERSDCYYVIDRPDDKIQWPLARYRKNK